MDTNEIQKKLSEAKTNNQKVEITMKNGNRIIGKPKIAHSNGSPIWTIDTTDTNIANVSIDDINNVRKI